MDRLRLTDIEPAEPAHPPAHDAGVLAPAPPAAQILLLQRQAGNQAVARMLGARAAPRAVARVTQTAVLTAVGSGGGSDAGPPGALTADPDADFNPWSIVHDLRRAIDQAEISEWDPESTVMRPTKRKVDAGLVMRVLDGLTADQVARVKRIYETQEKTTLENDLFEGGQSNAPSNLKPDQRARIKVLLEGHGAEGRRRGVREPARGARHRAARAARRQPRRGQARARDDHPPPAGRGEQRDRGRLRAALPARDRRGPEPQARRAALQPRRPAADGERRQGGRAGDRGEAPQARRAAGEARDRPARPGRDGELRVEPPQADRRDHRRSST